MGQFKPLPIVGGCYSDDAKPFSAQDCVNYLPVKSEAGGTRSDGKLSAVPGMIPFCGTQVAPVRGTYNAEGRFFAVVGTTLYLIAPAGTWTALGTVGGTGRVSFAHNQITGGNEVVVVNGTQGFVYNTKLATFAQITDVDFPGSAVIRYLGQYLIGVKPDGTDWFTSDLATATTWFSTDTYEAESSPDLIRGLEVSQNRLLVLGTRTIEEWVNEPNEGGTAAFQRGAVIERGTASPHCNVIMDNSLIWLGDDGIVYRLNGYTPTRISTFPIEQAISASDLSGAFAFAWEDRGHKVFYLTLPDGHTWGYDIASGVWHRRQSYGLDRWRANSLTKWTSGNWYAGDYDNGTIYRLDWDEMREGCDALVRERIGPVISNNENRFSVNAIALTLDVGRPQTTVHHAAPVVTGALPDGTVADVVSYQYTLTGYYPGEPVTAVISSGALPTGLSMSSTGLVTGTITASGSFMWTITATGTCGDTGNLPDASVVAPLTYMAVGASGKIYTTTSLSGTWVSRTSGTGLELRAVTQGVTNSIAVGGTAGTQVLLYSADRVTWNAATNVGSGSYYGVAASKTSVVVVSQPGGTTDGVVLRSTNDGASYTSITIPSGAGPLTGICYAAGTYVACSNTGKILVSTDDGVTWAKYTAGTDFLAVTYNAGEWMLVGNQAETATAADPTGAWTARSAIGGASFSFLAVAPGLSAGHYLAGANGGSVYAGIYTTTDHGATWTRSGVTTENINGFAHIGADLIGLSTFSSVWVSQDESTWSEYAVVNGFSMNAMFANLA